MVAQYVSLAQRLTRSIQEGVIRPGERLPSLRAFCGDEGISLMTALAAYRRLEDAGLVEALPRSGYRVRGLPLPGPASAPASRIFGHTRERDALVEQILAAVANPGLEPLGLGCPTPDRYPLEALRRKTGKLLSAHPELWTVYSPPPGNPELRRQIARRLQARGLEVNPREILVTIGASEALSLVMRLILAPGDLLAVPCPAYFGLLDAARTAGARILEFPEGPEGAQAEVFQRASAGHALKAVALVPAFSNPRGCLMSLEAQARWLEVLRERGVALVEDDLYGDLAFDGRKPKPMMALARPDGPPCFLVGGFSKSLLPGGRVGYVVAREPWIQGLLELKRAASVANVTLAERLVADCLESGLYDRHLRRLVPALFQGVETLRQEVARHFPAGTRVSAPRGGFVLWVELPEGYDGVKLFHAAREAGISIAPGPIFTLGPGLERFVRLNGGARLGRGDTIARLGRLVRGQ